MALDNFNDLQAYNRDVIVALHTDLTDFVYGDIKRLEEKNSTLLPTSKILFMEWPSLKPREKDGSADIRFTTGIAILSKPTSELHSLQDAELSANVEIAKEILLRYRKDQNAQGHHFSLNNIRSIDPVRLHTISGWIGCRFELEIGDWLATAVNPAKWTDL